MLAVTAWLISVTPASLRRITSNLLLFAEAWPVWNSRIGLVLLVLPSLKMNLAVAGLAYLSHMSTE